MTTEVDSSSGSATIYFPRGRWGARDTPAILYQIVSAPASRPRQCPGSPGEHSLGRKGEGRHMDAPPVQAARQNEVGTNKVVVRWRTPEKPTAPPSPGALR